MKITVLGRGNVGDGLADLWPKAGHEVTTLGSDGGDTSGADVVVVAIPSSTIADALSKAGGVWGKVAIDATNAFHGRDEGFDSLAQQVKSIVGGPTAKSFNLNFAALYDRIGDQRAAPGNLYAADDEAHEPPERLIRDAGFDPVCAGDLENARLLEDHIQLRFAVDQTGLGSFFYRTAEPGKL